MAKKIIQLCLLLTIAASCHVNAQAILEFVPQTDLELSLDSNAVTYTLRNSGNADSQLVNIKVWASIDANIDDNDVFSEGVPRILRPAGQNTDTVFFRLPIPNDTRPLQRLIGDNRDPLDWIGETVFTRACALDVANGNAIIARTCVDRNFFVIPIAPEEVPIASNGEEDFIVLTWRVPEPDGVNQLIDSYTITETGPGNITPITLPISEIPTTDINGTLFYRLQLSGRVVGREYRYFEIEGCLQVPAGSLACNMTTGISVGNSLAIYPASTNLRNGIRFSWQSFSEVFDYSYLIERCDPEQPTVCQIIANEYNGTTFLDTNLEPEERYFYKLFALDQAFGGSSNRVLDKASENLAPKGDGGGGGSFLFAMTTIGEVSIADEFEEDDTAQEATLVRRPVVQIRSFDTADDPDWIRFKLGHAQPVNIITNGSTSHDTEITVYDSAMNKIAENDTPDSGTLYAAIEDLMLDPGEYFVLVNQKPDGPPGSIFFDRVREYTLEVDLRGVIDISAIVSILLDDEADDSDQDSEAP